MTDSRTASPARVAEVEAKVTVLLAVSNGERYIEDAISSVISQSYRNFELVVVSNGSTDATGRICRGFEEADSRVRVFELPTRNKNAAYNFAFSKSTGDLICFFAADDKLPHDSLTERVRALLGEGKEAYSTCCLQTFAEDPKYDGIVFPRNRARPNHSGGSVMFSRALAERIFPLPVEQPNEDTWASLHLRAFGKNRHVAKPLYLYRIHGENSYGYGMPFSEKRTQYLRRMHAYQLFYDKYRDATLPFLRTDILPFLEGLRAATEGSIARIMRVKDLRVGSKLILALYSSPTMYRIRNAYFRTLSGGIAR